MQKADANSRQVTDLARIGHTNQEIADFIRISPGMLEKRYAEELTLGRTQMKSVLRKTQLENAIKEKNTSMLIWLGKQYLGQKDSKHQLEHSGGLTLEKVDFSNATIQDAVNEVFDSFNDDEDTTTES